MENEKTAIYIAYFAVAIIIDGLKLVSYVRNSEKFGKTRGQSAWEWFFEKSAENVMSWMGTILITWVAGYAFINQVAELADNLGAVVSWMPLSIPTAALVAWIVSYKAPDLMKKLVNK